MFLCLTNFTNLFRHTFYNSTNGQIFGVLLSWYYAFLKCNVISACVSSIIPLYASVREQRRLMRITDPGAFDLLVNLVELQCVSHLSYRRGLVLCRQNKIH